MEIFEQLNLNVSMKFKNKLHFIEKGFIDFISSNVISWIISTIFTFLVSELYIDENYMVIKKFLKYIKVRFLFFAIGMIFLMI